ncbi:hypothetical protein [Roseomonas elaeocarpi]|uniref:Uncharacterized protein n=1 Tax=Roseomonas elaeocarpi TaxID=907779 RepID=A0ABV6K024_9PROT
MRKALFALLLIPALGGLGLGAVGSGEAQAAVPHAAPLVAGAGPVSAAPALLQEAQYYPPPRYYRGPPPRRWRGPPPRRWHGPPPRRWHGPPPGYRRGPPPRYYR